ncbi:hypothetical protein BC332_14125 [Capsicum chinense]|nr:hypothetical protein BC332_14125 [Capsicum chinense]
MDPTLYNAAVEGNISNGDFVLAEYLKRDEENEYEVTPTGNTILHVAAHYSCSHFVAEVLKFSPALLCHQNKKNETALHIAANEGHIEVAHLLLSIDEHHKETLMRMTDENGDVRIDYLPHSLDLAEEMKKTREKFRKMRIKGTVLQEIQRCTLHINQAPHRTRDTALHKAVRSRHRDVVKLFVKEDSEFKFPFNKARETPLYLAAESSLREALSEILNSCKQPTSSLGPLNRTPLHAACYIQLLLYGDKSSQDLDYLWSLSKVGARSQLVAMSAVVIAFVTGMYATLAHSVGHRLHLFRYVRVGSAEAIIALQSDKRRLTNRPWPLESIGNSLGGAYVNIGDSLGGAYVNIGDILGGAYVNIGNGMGGAYVRKSVT